MNKTMSSSAYYAIFFILLVSFLAVSCSDDGSGATYSVPKAEYVALGDSLTAGVQSAGLRYDWQESSYPALIAQGLGVTEFEQPLIDDPGIGMSADIISGAVTPLYYDSASRMIKVDDYTGSVFDLLSNESYSYPYHNLGVPGAESWDLANHTADFEHINFYFVLRDIENYTATAADQAILQDPEIITLWIGNNDVLGGISSGTVNTSTTTSITDFELNMDELLGLLLDNTDALIYVANIPDITTIPFVTLLPLNSDAIFAAPDDNYGPILGSATYTIPASTPLITDETPAFVLLSALEDILLGDGISGDYDGSNTSLPGNYTLTSAEVSFAQNLITGYNTYLAARAAGNDRIILIDVNQYMTDLAGVPDDGIELMIRLDDSEVENTKFSDDGIFSLDGVHLNSAGYQVIADKFLETIIPDG